MRQRKLAQDLATKALIRAGWLNQGESLHSLERRTFQFKHRGIEMVGAITSARADESRTLEVKINKKKFMGNKICCLIPSEPGRAYLKCVDKETKEVIFYSGSILF